MAKKHSLSRAFLKFLKGETSFRGSKPKESEIKPDNKEFESAAQVRDVLELEEDFLPDTIIGRLPDDDIQEFLVGQRRLYFPQSSVWKSAGYTPKDHILIMEANNGGVYLVHSVTEQEAEDFARYPSKGKWYWNNVRVRGSRTRHRKRVTRFREI